MKKVIFSLLAIACCTQGYSQDMKRKGTRQGEAAGYASRDATALSMMGWGIALSVGIATLFSLLDNNSTSHTH